MRIAIHLVLAALSILPLQSRAASAPQMIRKAIEQGHAEGILYGPVAENSRLKLNATGALNLNAKRLYLFDQPGCARLQLDFVQSDALLPGSATPAPYRWSTEMSICTDGQSPLTIQRSTK
jgi:hypothetical protein